MNTACPMFHIARGCILAMTIWQSGCCWLFSPPGSSNVAGKFPWTNAGIDGFGCYIYIYIYIPSINIHMIYHYIYINYNIYIYIHIYHTYILIYSIIAGKIIELDGGSSIEHLWIPHRPHLVNGPKNPSCIWQYISPIIYIYMGTCVYIYGITWFIYKIINGRESLRLVLPSHKSFFLGDFSHGPCQLFWKRLSL